MTLRCLSASQVLPSFKDTVNWGHALSSPNKGSRGKSRVVSLGVQFETFSFVRIIIISYVWYKDTLSVRASFKFGNQSKPLGQAVAVSCSWKKRLPVDSWAWAVDPTPHRAPCRDQELLFSRAAMAFIAQQVSFLLAAPISLCIALFMQKRKRHQLCSTSFIAPHQFLPSSSKENKLKKTEWFHARNTK